MPGNRLRGAFGKLGILTTTVFLAHAVFVTLPALGELRADDGNDVPFRMDIRSVHSHVRQGTVTQAHTASRRPVDCRWREG